MSGVKNLIVHHKDYVYGILGVNPFGYMIFHLGYLRGCRPFIGVDGCHLTGPFGGILLSVVALDGNNGLFPVAFAVVESENRESWTYFFNCLKLAIGVEGASHCTIISDRQKGVDPALNDVLPEAERMICCRHLYANLKSRHHLTHQRLKLAFWAAAWAYSEHVFLQEMEKIRSLHKEAYNDLMDVPLHLWARHKFSPMVKCDQVTSNFVESFNSKLEDFRSKPIMTMLEGLRRRCMTKLNDKREKAKAWQGYVCPRPSKILSRNQLYARNCFPKPAGSRIYEVEKGNDFYIVNVKEMTCDCKVCDITGIPCKHAIACLREFRGKFEEYVHPCYTVETYREAHSEMIVPVPSPKTWLPSERPLLDPPPLRRLPGRPKKARKREPGEEPKQQRSHTVRCTLCGIMGHNKRACGRAPVKKKRIKGGEESSVGSQRPM
ncbi:hypothetical protein Ancab_037193 [Ancistrocladus abbreviatus]